MINLFLLFMYVVNLLWEFVGGIYWLNVMKVIWIMVGLFVVFGVVGMVVYLFIEEKMMKFKEVVYESYIFY